MPRPVRTADLFAEAAPSGMVAAERAKLEALLAELMGLKQRLKAARI